MRRSLISWSCVMAISCGGSEDDEPEACEPSYFQAEGEPCPEASDEAWLNLSGAAKRAVADDALAPVIASPEQGARLAAGEMPPTFSWGEAPTGCADATASLAPSPPAARPRLSTWRRVLAALAPIGVAHAHCPTTGDAYLAEVTGPGGCLLAHMTGHPSWTLSDDEWQALGALADEPLRLTVTWAYLNQNVISEGPCRQATEQRFEVEP